MVADATYGNGEFVQWLMERGITPYMRTQDSALRKNNPLYNPDRFTYLPESNSYRCPAGQQLNYVGLNVRNRAHAYIGSHKRCGACSQKAQCTTGQYKYLAIHIHEPSRQRARDLAAAESVLTKFLTSVAPGTPLPKPHGGFEPSVFLLYPSMPHTYIQSLHGQSLNIFKDSELRQSLAVALLVFALSGSAAVWKLSSEATPALRTKEVQLLEIVHPHGNPFQQFPESFPLQVAVFWTNPGPDPENPLPLVHSLKEMGIPFFITRDLPQALRHRLVILYPSVDSHTFTQPQADQLTTFVRQGGSIFAQNVFWGGLQNLFGFRSFAPSRKRYHLAFSVTKDPVTKYLNRPEERETQLGSDHFPEIIWSNGYVPDPGAEVLARFDDGSAALLTNSVGKGKVYLLGLSLLDVVLRNQNNRDYEAQRHYVNAFEPGADVWLLVLRAWYEAYGKDWVRLSTIPGGQRSALLLSHDVDWENSFAPGLDFARIEKANQASSTFFIQTKYVDDANSKAFLFAPNLDILRQLKAGGSTVGSHSIIHSRGFNKFELGSGHETYSSYQPRGLGFDTASGATVFGEVRVSKELLDGEIPGQDTIFFRAGHLRAPVSLPEALERSGYQFDSSFTADDVLSNFPFALPRDFGFEEDSEIYEFPVTIEDEESPGFAKRVPQALQVILANAENGAVSVVLIHSNESILKAAAEQDLLRQLPPDIVKTDMLTFAKFWRARDRLQWSLTATSVPTEAVLQVKSDESVIGLTFEFQRPIATVTGGATMSPDNRHLVLPELVPGHGVSIHINYLH